MKTLTTRLPDRFSTCRAKSSAGARGRGMGAGAWSPRALKAGRARAPPFSPFEKTRRGGQTGARGLTTSAAPKKRGPRAGRRRGPMTADRRVRPLLRGRGAGAVGGLRGAVGLLGLLRLLVLL